MRAEYWKQILSTSEGQHGLVTPVQVRAIGCPERSLRRAIEDGMLTTVRKGVLGVPGSAVDPYRPIMAATLAGGAGVVGSHVAGGWLWDYPQLLPETLEVTALLVPRPRLEGVVVHRSTVVCDGDVDERHGVPVTSAVRTAIDLASCLSLHLLARFIDHALRRRFTTIDELALRLDLLGGRGRSGTRVFRLLVNERREGLAPGDSDAEVRVVRSLVGAGLPRPRQNFQVVVGDRVFVLDLAWPPAKVAVELDGFDPHSTRTAFDHDRERDLVLRRAGWEVIRISTATDLHLLAAYLWTRLPRPGRGSMPHLA